MKNLGEMKLQAKDKLSQEIVVKQKCQFEYNEHSELVTKTFQVSSDNIISPIRSGTKRIFVHKQLNSFVQVREKSNNYWKRMIIQKTWIIQETNCLMRVK